VCRSLTAGKLYCHARLRGKPSEEVLEADLDLVNEQGQVLAHLEGLALKRMAGAARKGRRLSECLLEQRWVAAPLVRSERAVEPGHWLILADRDGLGARLASLLEERGHQVTLAFSGADIGQLFTTTDYQGVVHLWSDGCNSALEATQAMLATSSQARLWLVALGVEQSPLAGLSLVIGQEHPELRCCLLEPDRRVPTRWSWLMSCCLRALRCAWPGTAAVVTWRESFRPSSSFRNTHGRCVAIALI